MQLPEAARDPPVDKRCPIGLFRFAYGQHWCSAYAGFEERHQPLDFSGKRLSPRPDQVMKIEENNEFCLALFEDLLQAIGRFVPTVPLRIACLLEERVSLFLFPDLLEAIGNRGATIWAGSCLIRYISVAVGAGDESHARFSLNGPAFCKNSLSYKYDTTK